MKWIEGKPPKLETNVRIWIVAKIPALFTKGTYYKTAVWNGEGWSEKEVERATWWAALEDEKLVEEFKEAEK